MIKALHASSADAARGWGIGSDTDGYAAVGGF